MKSTRDYSLFKDFSSNRDVDMKHVNNLVKAIQRKNLLHVNPIVVDMNMRVIDGQHRLEAARILNLEIFYITEDIDRKDISMLNSNQKNWTAMDYINFYTIEKVDAFVKLSHLINKYPQIAISALLTLSNGEGRRCLGDLKEGILDTSNIAECIQICDFILDLNKRHSYDFVFDSRFPLALMEVFHSENFNPENLLNKINQAPRVFVRCHTKRQYLEMIQEVYNRNLSKNSIRVAV